MFYQIIQKNNTKGFEQKKDSKTPYITALDESPGKKQKLKKKTTNNYEENLESLKDQVNTYENVFLQLRNETGKDDVNGMVETFMDYEYNNYSLFTLINEYANELERLEKEKKSYLETIEKLQNPPEETDSKATRIRDLNEELKSYDNKLKVYQNKHTDLMKIINSLKVSIPNVFERLGCNAEEYAEREDIIVDFIDQNLDECDELNMHIYMSIIEKRTNDILQMYSEVFNNQVF